MNYNDYGCGFISIPYTEPKIYQQGWVCPKCGGVYSPSQHCCPNCTPAQGLKVTWGTGTAGPSTEPPNNISISHTGWTSSALHPNCDYDIKIYGCAETKRGRGRPRIHPVKPKRPVGRPRKIVK